MALNLPRMSPREAAASAAPLNADQGTGISTSSKSAPRKRSPSRVEFLQMSRMRNSDDESHLVLNDTLQRRDIRGGGARANGRVATPSPWDAGASPHDDAVHDIWNPMPSSSDDDDDGDNAAAQESSKHPQSSVIVFDD